jgi:hypothetical protein
MAQATSIMDKGLNIGIDLSPPAELFTQARKPYH